MLDSQGYTRLGMRRGVTLLACLAAGLIFTMPSSAAVPLRTAIVDPPHFNASGSGQALAFQRTRAVGASMARLNLTWGEVSPHDRPPGFDSADHRSPGYNWARFDRQVIAAVNAGLTPIVSISYAPSWAEGPGAGSPGTRNPNAVEFGRFARAAATRYSGSYVPPDAEPTWAEPLPAVRYWQAWNEPNRDYFFRPQYRGRSLVSPGLYRAMVNRFAAGVRPVHPANKVIAGGLAPLGRPGKPGPMPFMRAFLSQRADFDIWAHHPYTSGGPTHRAPNKNDVSLGNLPTMRALLRSSARTGRVGSRGPVAFWVTEFSWDTKGPDPRGVPTALHARWTSEALYRMWRSGVSLVTWYRIQDDPLRATPYQSGFFTAAGARKRSLTAFRFPTVAFGERGGLVVWGRTPTSAAGSVVVEIKTGRSWRRLGTLRANSGGIFSKTFRTPYRKGHVRARFARETSVPFSLTRVANRYVNPFGCGGTIPC